MTPDLEANRRNAMAFYDLMFNQGQPAQAVERYVGSTYTGPDYSFLLMIKRTDNESVRATLRGDEYEGSIAWENLKACSSSSS